MRKFNSFLLLFMLIAMSNVYNHAQSLNNGQTGSIIFQSSDGGKSWNDLSAGLPDSLQLNCGFVQDGEVFLGTRNGNLYTRKEKTGVWELQNIDGNDKNDLITGIFPGRTGIYVASFRNGFFRKATGTNVWQPMHTMLENKTVHAVLENSDGTLFVASPTGIYRSVDDGKTWKHVFAGGWTTSLVSDGKIVVASSSLGLLRSTDNGESWYCVLTDERSVYNTSIIENRLVALRVAGPSYTPPNQTSWFTFGYQHTPPRISISADGGSTWQRMYEGLAQGQQMYGLEWNGEYLFCSHQDGISRSSNLGKTWELVFPNSQADDFTRFELVVSGTMVYAILVQAGC
jgi:photosystem II stability/assembly factor-like uncharacterized protein